MPFYFFAFLSACIEVGRFCVFTMVALLFFISEEQGHTATD